MADEYKNNTTGAVDDGCMDWDDAIENDGEEFVSLPEGDYLFEVCNFVRGRFPGSAKIPPCNKASLTLRVKPESGGVAMIYTDLILYRTLEWKISSFFRCIGQKKHGERLVMDWNNVIGAKGRAHIKPRTYTGNDGKERTVNDVEKFLDYDEEKMPEPGVKFQRIADAALDADELPF